MLDFICSFSCNVLDSRLCKFSISSVIISISSFNFCFKLFISSNLLFSSSFWVFNICVSSIIFANFSLYSFMLYTNSPISMFFNSSFRFKYFLAFSDCSFNGSIFCSISYIMSFILNRFSFVCSNFFQILFFWLCILQFLMLLQIHVFCLLICYLVFHLFYLAL